MKQHVAHRSAVAGRGIQQQIAEFRIVTVKPDYDAIARWVRSFKFPTLWTLDDLLPKCGLKTQADRVHLSRALRRAGVTPLRGKKIWLTVANRRIRAYVWCVYGRMPDLKSAAQIRREYHSQRHIEQMQLIDRIQQQVVL